MKYAVEMDSGAIIYKFHEDWFRHSKVNLLGIRRHTDSMERSRKLTFILSK
jgi:hypothetical protein